jgi:hypothetical protein
MGSFSGMEMIGRFEWRSGSGRFGKFAKKGALEPSWGVLAKHSDVFLPR